MNEPWHKKYLPRSLYGRAALILILPVVTIQLVVSIVFIQRHFEGVTYQMTRNVLAEVNYLVNQTAVTPDLAMAVIVAERLGDQLDFGVRLPVPLDYEDRRNAYDLSGRVVIRTLRDQLANVTGVDLTTDWRTVIVSVETPHGGMQLLLPRSRVSASNPHQLLVLMILTSVLMTLIAFIFLRNQLRPIARLARASDAFGKGRHIHYKPSGAREVRLAGQAFLDMRARIERQIEQRTLMLSGVSHDLRTPLTRLSLALSMLEDDDEAAAMQRDVKEMERLVDEFLSFARGDALDDPELVDAAALTRDVVEDAHRAGQAVALAEVTETGEVTMRPQAITRALENLIGNAVRYGEAAWVSVTPMSRSIRFRVEDNGPGIPENLHDQAVKPFARLDPARSQSRGSGVGLGLSIAADIARRHGGSLKLGRSEAYGGLRADLILAR